MKQGYVVTIFFIFLVQGFNASAQNVDFPDENLAAKVRVALGLAPNAPIPRADLQAHTLEIRATRAGITDLTGLEWATNTTQLILSNNAISNLSPLSGLTQLRRLHLRGNSISDISDLSGLNSLTRLHLGGNSISDISDLSGLTNLEVLHLLRNAISNLTPLSGLNSLTELDLSRNSISDISDLSGLANLTDLRLGENSISDISDLSGLTNLEVLHLSRNAINDLTPLSGLTNLTELGLSGSSISDISDLSGLTNLKTLYLSRNAISNLTPLSGLTQLIRLYLDRNSISDISDLSGLTSLTTLHLSANAIRDLTPLSGLTALKILTLCELPNVTDITPIASLTSLTYIVFDEALEASAKRILATTAPTAYTAVCRAPDIPEPEPEPEPEVKPRRRIITRCGLGWSPQSQYQHHENLPKVMIYALEFEWDPGFHGRYICKTIEIRTGDDAIENLTGWKLYLGILYNQSLHPVKIPEEHSQITDNILRITPEMLGLETFPCNTVNGTSHPLPGIHYVLWTDENVLVDTAYTCFVWGQNAWTTVNGINVKSPRRLSSAAFRAMDPPRIERYIMKPNSVFITYTGIEGFGWDRVVLSDWLLAASEERVVGTPNAPSLMPRNLGTTWGALKK